MQDPRAVDKVGLAWKRVWSHVTYATDLPQPPSFPSRAHPHLVTHGTVAGVSDVCESCRCGFVDDNNGIWGSGNGTCGAPWGELDTDVLDTLDDPCSACSNVPGAAVRALYGRRCTEQWAAAAMPLPFAASTRTQPSCWWG